MIRERYAAAAWWRDLQPTPEQKGIGVHAKPFKSARPEPRPSPQENLDGARSHDPTLPPAAMRPNPAPDSPGELVQLNVRVDRKLAD